MSGVGTSARFTRSGSTAAAATRAARQSGVIINPLQVDPQHGTSGRCRSAKSLSVPSVPWPSSSYIDLAIPTPFSWSERHAHGPGFLRRELLQSVALHRPLPNDHQPEQPLGLLSHRLWIARALVPRHGRGIHADLRSKVRT